MGTISNAWRDAFLDVLAKTGNVTEACNQVGVSRMTAYNHRDRDQAFSDQWDNALQQAADVLEAEAWRRAKEGYDEPQFYKGAVCGYVRKFSDQLLMFMLRGLRPERYRERMVLSPDQLDKLIERELNRAKDDKPLEVQADCGPAQ